MECLRVSSRDPKPSEKEFMLSCGGLFKDFTVHDFDTTHFLMGEKPVKIFAQGSAIFLDYLKEVNDYDTAVIVLSYKNG